MLKLLLVLVPTVLLFGCRTSIPGVAGLSSATQTVGRPAYTDPFAGLDEANSAGNLATPGEQSAPASFNPAPHTPTGMPVDPFSEFQQPAAAPASPGATAAPADTTETSWYEAAESGSTVVSDLQTESSESGDSQGWRPTRSPLSAN